MISKIPEKVDLFAKSIFLLQTNTSIKGFYCVKKVLFWKIPEKMAKKT